MAASRRLYQDMAETIRWHYSDMHHDEATKRVIRMIVTHLCDDLQEDNPNFNRQLFLSMCGWGVKTDGTQL